MKLFFVYLWAPFANLLWYIHTVVMGSLSLLVWPFDRAGNKQFWCARWWCRLVAWSIFSRIRVHGVEHVRSDQPYVYMANHSSLIDTPALFACLPYPFRIMAKRGLFYVPFMGWHLWTAGHFPIDRGNAAKMIASLRRVIEGVKHGRSLAVFPEGTRSSDGKLQEFQPGMFRIALKGGVPIVPVTILGTFDLLPKTTLAPRPGRVHVILGEPIDTTDYDEKRVNALIARTRGVIQQTLDAERPPKTPPQKPSR